MTPALEECLRQAEKKVEICQRDLERAEAVLVGVKLTISAWRRDNEIPQSPFPVYGNGGERE